MKTVTILLVTVAAAWYMPANGADETVPGTETLASRGKGVVSQDDFTARVNRIPAYARQEILRSESRVRDLLVNLLLRAQLAADAREAGFDKEEIVQDRMRLAADSELADAWLQHYVDSYAPADYELLAREQYMLNEHRYKSPGKIDVSHILISADERSDEEAQARAESVHQQVLANPDRFDELVRQYSDDPSAASNQGSFKGVKKGDLVSEFEQVAFAMKAGEISAPVKTRYGYHVIRLDAHIAPAQLSFENVKDSLITQARQLHEDRIKSDYVGQLSAQELHMTEESMLEMVRRQFGDDFFQTEVKETNPE